MTIAGFLPLIVCVLGLVIWAVCSGATKASAAEVGKIAFAAGLLAFLLGAGAIVESCSTLDHSAASSERHK